MSGRIHSVGVDSIILPFPISTLSIPLHSNWSRRWIKKWLCTSRLRIWRSVVQQYRDRYASTMATFHMSPCAFAKKDKKWNKYRRPTVFKRAGYLIPKPHFVNFMCCPKPPRGVMNGDELVRHGFKTYLIVSMCRYSLCNQLVAE